jgi:hypothetical protein
MNHVRLSYEEQMEIYRKIKVTVDACKMEMQMRSALLRVNHHSEKEIKAHMKEILHNYHLTEDDIS